MTCTGADNIYPIPIQGTFDDAQAIVKELMGDLVFKEEMRLSAINSINVVRILAQCVYYIHAFTQLPPDNRDDISFVVPTGNFGNIFAGWMVHQMGLPVDRFVVATNQNDILYRLFNSGEYKPDAVRPSHAPSMDIQVASNFERFLYYHNEKNAKATMAQMDQFKADGSIKIPNFNASNFAATRSTDEDILKNIRMVKEKYDYIVDPHTACGFQDLDLSSTHVILATAHPAKFPDTIRKAIGEAPTDPALEKLKNKEQVKYPVAATADAVRPIPQGKRDLRRAEIPPADRAATPLSLLAQPPSQPHRGGGLCGSPGIGGRFRRTQSRRRRPGDPGTDRVGGTDFRDGVLAPAAAQRTFCASSAG
jgi:threonine synthase